MERIRITHRLFGKFENRWMGSTIYERIFLSESFLRREIEIVKGLR